MPVPRPRRTQALPTRLRTRHRRQRKPIREALQSCSLARRERSRVVRRVPWHELRHAAVAGHVLAVVRDHRRAYMDTAKALSALASNLDASHDNVL